MRIAVLTSGQGWHLRDLQRAADELGHEILPVSWRRLLATVGVRDGDGLTVARPPDARVDLRAGCPILRGSLRRVGDGTCTAETRRSAAADQSPTPDKQPSGMGHPPGGPPPDSRIDLRRVDCVLLRTVPSGSLEQIILRMDALQRLETTGVPVINAPRAMEACVDKYLASARLAAAGLPTPAVAACEQRDEAMQAFDALGRDVVLKPLFGAEGKGITRITDPELAYRAFQLLEQHNGVIHLQRYVAHCGHDLRAFVLDGRVLAAVRREADRDWRHNLSLGGRAESIELTAEQRRLAVKAAETLAARVAGVDLLPTQDGRCYILEVNAVPGWKGLGEATGLDVGRELLQFLQRCRP